MLRRLPSSCSLFLALILCATAIDIDNKSRTTRILHGGLNTMDTSKQQQSYGVVIIGGGLAGLVSAISASEVNDKISVLLLEKEARVGGNSAKASSGMNAHATQVQKNHPQGQLDSIESFVSDTYKSSDGLGNRDLIETLANQSLEAEQFLTTFGIELRKLVLLGGHSYPRTHKQGPPSPGERPSNVGYYIISKFTKAIEEKKNIDIVTHAIVKQIIEKDEDAGYIIEFEDNNVTEKTEKKKQVTAGSIVMASGGFGADVRGFLQDHQVSHLPSTNGKFATGDGIRLATPLGASIKHMDKIQIHPTSFVDPKDPTCSTKFLAPESLRGHGAILVNPQTGCRFINELNRRDTVTDAIFQRCSTTANKEEQVYCWLIMNQNAVDNFGPEFGFYKFKGFFEEYSNAQEFAKKNKFPEETVQQQLLDYGKGKDAFGKTTFPSFFTTDEKLFASKVTPAIHYTMGGLSFNTEANVLDQDNKPLPNLFAAGEVTGGLHGQNRLGGNSLLECVVFGRIAGKNAACAAAGDSSKL